MKSSNVFNSKLSITKKNYQSFYVLVFLLFITFQISDFSILTCSAQGFGVGASSFTPDACAMLEVQASDKGVLIPRILWANKPAAPINGVLIYSTDGNGSDGAGFYYYDGTIWKKLGGSGTVTSISQGTGMSFSVNPITTTGTINLANTAVTPGSYTNTNLTVDAQGRITAASNGSGGGGISMSCATNNYLTKRSSASDLSCSQVFDDATHVFIGVTSSTTSDKLHVEGAMGASNSAGYFKNTSTSVDGYGVYGECSNTDYYGYGGYFKGGYTGVYGKVTATSNKVYNGLWGEVTGGTASGNPALPAQDYGVMGLVTGGTNEWNTGVCGSAIGSGLKTIGSYGIADGTATQSYGVFGSSWSTGSINYGVCGDSKGSGTTNYAIYGVAMNGTTNWAGYFSGNVNVSGTLSKGAGSFLIDHPDDPLHKTLRHNFVESPENLCMYRGTIQIDSTGEGKITMPSYFISLTKEDGATVSLTPVGKPFDVGYEWDSTYTKVTVYGQPGREISYIVLADRDDPVMKQLYKPVEMDKGSKGSDCPDGKLFYPKAYGFPDSMAVDYNSNLHTNIKPSINNRFKPTNNISK